MPLRSFDKLQGLDKDEAHLHLLRLGEQRLPHVMFTP